MCAFPKRKLNMQFEDFPKIAAFRENPEKNWSNLAKIANFAKFCKIKFCKFFGGLVLGCIKTKFARKYAFDSIFQALQDVHTFAPLQSQNFSKKSVLKISN